ncbi:MAG: UvrD-helicase domain-containing protein, partial [Oscillospiraceae bacterium]|nr:UvrD-helicase domain-containing protein [Oscillospiraceae bacterium]
MTNAFEQRFLAARRAAIAAVFSNLNEMQQKAVLTTEGPLLLLAGAGSGKTTVLINRIANLIEYGCGSDSNEIPSYVNEDDVLYLEDFVSGKVQADHARVRALCALRPVAPWSIIAITFTNKAANELKTRLQAMLGEQALDIWAMTFHSACCRILRRDIDRLGYSSSFTIYDTSDSEHVIKDIVKEQGLDDKAFAARMILSVISRAKDKRQSPEEFETAAATSGDYRMERIADIYAEYQKRLKNANALDFDDIILRTVELLENFDDVRLYYQRKFQYVLIDEYQDTNLLQYQLSALLAGGYENICVVGDDDQSIYKFRGATIENILDFEKQYRGAQVIRLEQNYRSTGSILQCANAVIANNRGRKGKTLWTKNPKGEQVHVHEASNESDEAQYVANRIIVNRSHGIDFKDNAVLYRTNAQSNAMEYAFKRSGIPYRIIGGTRYFDRAEVKDMLAYLCVINNRGDDLRLRRIINNPPRGIGAKTVEMAERQALAAGVSVYSVTSDPYSYPCLERAAQKLMAFTVMIEECEALLETMSLPDFYDEVLARTGYLAMLEEKDDAEAKNRAENVRELRSSIVNYMENTDTPTLAGFLEEIALYTDIEQYDADADAAVMMTMHSAKGLEF